jgi:predicted DNA-binding protein (MmcQ/YjbR family)
MKYEWLDTYCLSKKGVEKDYKIEWEATRYMVGGKMFAMQGGDKESRAIITVKLDPLHGEILRNEHKDITPGYYMNKTHWNSVYLDGDVPDDVLRAMLDESYNILFNSMSKKMQKDINQEDEKPHK